MMYTQSDCRSSLVCYTPWRCQAFAAFSVQHKCVLPCMQVARRVQGRCAEPPGADVIAALFDVDINGPEPWRAPGCTLLVSEQVFYVEKSRLWIDSLHIQFIEAGAGWASCGLTTAYNGHAYMTNTVIQGHRRSKATPVSALPGGGGIYAEGAAQPLHRI